MQQRDALVYSLPARTAPEPDEDVRGRLAPVMAFEDLARRLDVSVRTISRLVEADRLRAGSCHCCGARVVFSGDFLNMLPSRAGTERRR
ncbi:MAG: hypothetical protein ACYDB4_17745 [Candidatus Dormibacteraceae bacterium]